MRPPTIYELATRIKSAHADVMKTRRDVVRKAIDLGADLIAAKKQVGHGKWLPYLKDNCKLSDKTAQDYMKVSANKERVEGWLKSEPSADLGLKEVLRRLKGTSSNKGAGLETKYNNAQRSLLKNLGEMLADHAVVAAEATITELQKVVAELKPLTKAAA
jgi:hypothetical protein